MGSANDASLMMGLTSLLIPIVGILMALTPFLMKKSEVFAVTIPEAAASDPVIKGMKRRFFLIVLIATAILAALGLVCWLANYEAGVLVVVIFGILFLTGFGYALMLYFRSKVREYKAAKGWVADAQESVAVIGEREIPKAISLKWNFLYLPIMVLTLAIGYAGYGDMPDMVPMHMGFDGQVDRWVEKTPLIPWITVMIQAFLALCIVFSHWSITRSKRLSEPEAPAASALAYGMFARANSIFLLFTGLLICILLIAMPLSFMGVLTMMQAGAMTMVGALVVVIASLALALVYGQGGARLFARMEGSDELLSDNDALWKLGVFYWNPEDPSLFLPARFGIGWTINWARPSAWAIIIGGAVVTIAFVAAMMLFA